MLLLLAKRQRQDRTREEATVRDAAQQCLSWSTPCGAPLSYTPAAKRDIAATKKLDGKMCKGIFMGTGDYLVIGEELYTTAQRQCDVYVHRAREVHCESVHDDMRRRTPADVDFTADGAVDTGGDASSGPVSSPTSGAGMPTSEIEQLPNDEWILKANVLTRQRNKPRWASAMTPIPMDTNDVTQSTTTSLGTIDEGRIIDIRDGATNDTRLSSPGGVGETRFDIIKKSVPTATTTTRED